TVRSSLELAAGMVSTLNVKTDRMALASEDGFVTATDLADLLTKRGMPFREAHHVVAGIVRSCQHEGRVLRDLMLQEVKAHSDIFDSSAVSLRAVDAVKSREVPGGTAATQVEAALALADKRYDEDYGWAEAAALSLPSVPNLAQAALADMRNQSTVDSTT